MTRKGRQEVVVITGASAGVGRATVRAFAARGAKIGLLARGRAGLEGARKDVAALGGEALVLPVDVSHAEEVSQAAEAIERQFGPIDVWVNNAMVSVFSPVHEMTADEFKRVTEVTYLGVVNGTLAALHSMRPRNRGTIVQVGSALAYRGIPLQAAYCAAKHAIQGFTESLRCELLHDRSRVRITMVQMPALNTPQFSWVKTRLPREPQPVPPIYQPEVAAQAIVHAAHHYRRQWFVGGSTVVAIQGNKVAPGYGDRYLARHGYQSQQGSEPQDPQRRCNLDAPVDDEQDHGAHGKFDRIARPDSWQVSTDQHRGAIVGAGLVSAIAGSRNWGWKKGAGIGIVTAALTALGFVGIRTAASSAAQHSRTATPGSTGNRSLRGANKRQVNPTS